MKSAKFRHDFYSLYIFICILFSVRWQVHQIYQSFYKGKLHVGQEIENLLLLKVADVTHDLSLFVFVLTPHSLLDRPLLVNHFRSFIFFDQSLELLDFEVIRGRDNCEEELVVDEEDSLAAFLNHNKSTTIGFRLVLMLEKYRVISFSIDGMMKVSSLLSET
jgi:hypothetical protein